MLKLEVSGEREVVAALDQYGVIIGQELYKKISQLTLKLERKIKTEKLSGQVLGVKTGALRSSIYSEVHETAHEVVGRVVAPPNVPYGAAHEFGAQIHHPGGTAFIIDGKTGLATWVSNKSRLAEYLPRTKPHIINMPERSFMRSSLREMEPEIVEGIKDAVKQAIRKGGGLW